jgi:hydroxymethylbilane synthase
MRSLRIATRGSELALFQARAVAATLREQCGVTSEIVTIRTSGDRLAEAPLSQIGGKRLFVKEIEEALLAGEADLAVHSSKDMPAVLPDGLQIGAVLPREDARDALVLGEDTKEVTSASIGSLFAELGREPRIGTSSVRRSAQLTRVWPSARFLPIRGNLNTRLRKLDAGDFDALVLASAGLLRLQHAHRISAPLPIEVCVPAPGQGIIAIEVRTDDEPVRNVVGRIQDQASATALIAERALVVRLGGGCQMPIGAYADVSRGTMSMTAVVISLDGARTARARGEGASANPHLLGVSLAERLLANGADDILAEVQQAQAAVEGLQP